MHVHVWGYPQVVYPLSIANGVTGVRQMSEPGYGLDSMRKWRREIANGVRVGLRIVGTGGTIFSEQHEGEVGVRTAEEGRHAVDSLKAAGVDFVKFHEDNMVPEVYFAIAAEARRVGIPLVGYLPNSIPEIAGPDSGQRTAEHFNEVHCWWPPNAEPGNAWPPSTFPPADSAGVRRCAELAAAFVRNKAWFVPTLILGELSSGTPTAWQRYWPDSVRAQYQDLVSQGWGDADPTPERALEQLCPVLGDRV